MEYLTVEDSFAFAILRRTAHQPEIQEEILSSLSGKALDFAQQLLEEQKKLHESEKII